MITGHVEDRKSSWRIVIELDRENGKRDRIYKSVKKKNYKTMALAERLMNHTMIEIEQGTYIELSGMTLSEYLNKWLDFAKHNLEYKTYVRYKGIIDNYFKPELGFIKLENLKPLKIQEHYIWLGSQEEGCPGLSANTVRKHHNLLHKALGQARKWQLITLNPADNVDPPSITKYEARVLPTRDAIIQFLDRLKGTMLYLATILALTTSLRRGEICALLWQDVDWEIGRLYVRHSLQRVTGEGLKQKPTKNNKSRSVALPPTIINLLRHEYMTRYEGDPLGIHGDDYICAWPDGRPIAPDYLTHRFEKLNLPITFHGCRHSHDTLLLRNKVDPRLVADRAGRDVRLTQALYEHVLPDMQDEVAILIERTLFGDENDEKI
jgi:integrase